MLPGLVGALILSLYGLSAAVPTPDVRDFASWQDAAAALLPRATFRSAERAVTNWRQQAALQLDLPATDAAQAFAGGDVRNASRCVKLNNYWCIKRAGWSGEIASDSEGHVAFATALDGATVAAVLLRRYYLAYGKRSALAIVSRWAPAQCGGAITVAQRRPLKAARATPQLPKALRNNLRARFLASRMRGGPSMRRSIIADRSLSMMAAPEIAVGMGEHLIVIAPRRSAAQPADLSSLPLTGPSGGLAIPALSACVDSGPRIRNYAAHAIEGITAGVNDDLKLFDVDGTPQPNLIRLMLNMARVEIGPLAVRNGLVAAAIDQAQRQMPPVKSPAQPTDPKAAPAGG
jgi:hypothetical protein